MVNPELSTEPSHIDQIRRVISDYELAICGQHDIHYWIDARGAIQHTQTLEKDSEVLPRLPEEYSDEFVSSLGIVYAGTMSAELLERRKSELSAGNGIL